jgi:hypothetical protein
VNRHTCRLWRERFIAEGPEGLWEVPQVRGRKPEPGLAARIVKATTVTTVSDFTRANTIGRANGASPANQRRNGMRAVRHAGLATLSTPGGPQQEPTGAPILPRGPRGPLSLGVNIRPVARTAGGRVGPDGSFEIPIRGALILSPLSEVARSSAQSTANLR